MLINKSLRSIWFGNDYGLRLEVHSHAKSKVHYGWYQWRILLPKIYNHCLLSRLETWLCRMENSYFFPSPALYNLTQALQLWSRAFSRRTNLHRRPCSWGWLRLPHWWAAPPRDVAESCQILFSLVCYHDNDGSKSAGKLTLQCIAFMWFQTIKTKLKVLVIAMRFHQIRS